jgi:Flp pilus assembly protein TadG
MKNLNAFSRRLRENRGQALIEYILILPMVFLLILNLVNFGGLFYAFITVSNASRAGVNYAVLGGASVGALGPASPASVNALIVQDILSLPNAASLSVNICQNNNGTTKTLQGTCTAVPADPESASYVLTSVDVTYTYVPFISAWSFPKLGVFLTVPPTTLHQRAEMRTIQ